MSTTTNHASSNHRTTSALVWRELAKASFAVLSHVTPAGQPRSSGVVYRMIDRRMFVAVADDSWKARHIAANGQVAVTVPVRRGGVMALLLPIPPATISFRASAVVHPAGPLESGPLAEMLVSMLPTERQTSSRVIEITPEGLFVTYGLGVSLMQMRVPALARARVPVA
ncbi:pyridoxamine 5'-phosphate oxidase family protein [Phytohabitans houttuyneae]|uniref:pyridoxamine 5'-phosphate oxidase family protein n=1 Tax=Phytohabitans houttuyneae TaxID=1076126 RepID=UPI0031F153B2